MARTRRPYGLYLVLAVSVGLILLHLDAAPLLLFAAVGLLSIVAGLVDSDDYTN